MDSVVANVFPDYFPKQCPPDEAEPGVRQGYRLVRNDPPTESDFLPHVIKNPDKIYEGRNLCNACSVSLFADSADAMRARDISPHLANTKLAYGRVLPETGVVLGPSGGRSSHFDWWVYVGASPHQHFKVVGEN